MGAARARELSTDGMAGEVEAAGWARAGLALGCLAALLGFAAERLRCTFEPRTLRIAPRSLADRLALDWGAVAHLELLRNARTGGEAGSLLGALNLTLTRGGKRLLRASLLAPSAHEATLSLRLDCVEALVQPACAERTLLAGPLSQLVAAACRPNDDCKHNVVCPASVLIRDGEVSFSL